MPTPMTRCLPQCWPATARGRPATAQVRPRARYPQTVATWEESPGRFAPFPELPARGAPHRASPTGAGGTPSPTLLSPRATNCAGRPRTAATPPSDEAAVGLPWRPEPQQLRTRPRVRQGPGQARQQMHRPPRQSHAPPTAEQAPARARTCTCTCTCTTKALPAPLRPPTRRENQDPRRPKWRTSALSGAATL